MISEYLRLTKAERKAVDSLSIELNKARLQNEIGAIKESEVLHKLIAQALEKAKIKNGEVVI